MNISKERARLEKAEKVLKIIEIAQRRIEIREDMINGFASNFPPLIRKYQRSIDLLEEAIPRLEKYYIKILNKNYHGN